MIFTCPRCSRSYAVPEAFAGLICPCASLPPSQLTQAGAGAPSPAGIQGRDAPLGVSSGNRDGGRGAGESASGSPGRASEKGAQRSFKPVEKDPEIEKAEITPAAIADVKGFMSQRFFKKGGIDKALFGELLGASKAFGYSREKDGDWRPWFQQLVESNDKGALDKAARILAQAGAIKLAEPEGKKAANPVSRAILAALEADHDGNEKGLTLDDLKAKGSPGATETHINDLLDQAFIYETVPGRYRFNKQGVK